jgi:hypothetical protein
MKRFFFGLLQRGGLDDLLSFLESDQNFQTVSIRFAL